MNKQRVFIHWALMDFIDVLGFAYWNACRGRMPVCDDAVSFWHVNLQYGWSGLMFFFIASVLLGLSVFLIMVLFLKQHPLARLIAYLQTPLSSVFITWMRSKGQGVDWICRCLIVRKFCCGLLGVA